MYRGLDRAYQFARRMLAMHARHRHVIEFRIIQRALVIGINPQPEHLTISRHLLFAHNWNVVFDFAGDHARVAANACRQVNRHAPLVALIRIFPWIIERLFLVRNFDRFFQKIRLRQKLLQSARAINLPILSLDVVVGLRGNQVMTKPGFGDFHSRSGPERIRGSQQVSIETDAGAHPANSLSAVAKVQRERVFRLAGHNPDRRPQAAASEV